MIWVRLFGFALARGFGVLALATLLSRPCWAVQRVVLAVGSDHGLAHEIALRYGLSDARQFTKLMLEHGGALPAHVHRLLNPTKQQFEVTLQRALASVSSDSTFIFYFSGHGSNTHLHLEGERVSRAALRAQVQEAGGKLAILILDACRSTQERGGNAFRRAEPFAIGSKEYRGMVVIQSASRGESAFESYSLQGGLFTHHLTSGLRGAADQNEDGRVSLHEAYNFAHDRTLADSGSAQTPDLTLRISGAGSLELTRVFQTDSRVLLPSESATRYTVFKEGVRSAFADVWSASSHQVQIALPAGRFIVWRNSRQDSAIAEIEASPGRGYQLSDVDFRSVPRDEMLRRGGEEAVRFHLLGAFGGVSYEARTRAGGGTLELDYAWRPKSGPWTAGAGVGLARANFRHVGGNRVEQTDYRLYAGVNFLTLRAGSTKTWLGLGGVAALGRRHIESKAANGFVDESTFSRYGGYLRLTVRRPVSETLDWSLRLTGLSTLSRQGVPPGLQAAETVPLFEVETTMVLTTGLSLGY